MSQTNKYQNLLMFDYILGLYFVVVVSFSWLMIWAMICDETRIGKRTELNPECRKPIFVRVIIFLIKLYGHETNDQCKVKSDQLLIDLNQIKNKHSNNSLRCDIAKHMPHSNAILFVLLLFPSINGKNT